MMRSLAAPPAICRPLWIVIPAIGGHLWERAVCQGEYSRLTSCDGACRSLASGSPPGARL